MRGLGKRYQCHDNYYDWQSLHLSQLPLFNILFTVLFANVFSFSFACFVVRELCRSGCGQNNYLTHPPPPNPSIAPTVPFFSLPKVLSLIQVTAI